MPPTGAAETILHNGKIITMDSRLPQAEALAIRAGRIIAVGPDAAVQQLSGEDTQMIDLQGKTVIPGIIDAHNHLLSTGRQVIRQLSLFDVRSIEELVERVRERVAITPPGQWIKGRGWDESLLQEGRFPTRWDLDPVSPEHPVVLNRVWNMLVANSYALRLAGIDRNTPDPPPGMLYAGRIDRDPQSGEPTGILRDRAKHLVERVIPPESMEEMEETIKATCQAYLAVGITSVVEPGLLPQEMRAYQNLYRRGELPLRVSLCVAGWGFSSVDDLSDQQLKARIEEMGVYTGLGDHRLRIDAVKMMPDGGVGDRTAAMYEPYEGEPNNYGQFVVDPAEFQAAVQWCHERGWSVETHACGDRMTDIAVEAYASAFRQRETPLIRHRVHHAYLPTPKALATMATYGIVAIMNPPFLYNLGESYIRSIGHARAARMKPMRTYLEQGVPLAGSSDSPVTDYNPFVGIYSAVNRHTVAGTPLDQSERLSVEEALRMYTLGSAYVTFEEGIKGSLEAGKLADLVVLDRDILTVPVATLKEIQVEMTMVEGKVVYQKP
ncbi:MAG: amidohydrolase [Nitrospinota bacterium]|nr:MAG: amidohydrolase [Nitrospinota bacterium]